MVKEIDWEQRRYEVSKEIMSKMLCSEFWISTFFDEIKRRKEMEEVLFEDFVREFAVRNANKLVEDLKNRN